LIQFSQKYSNQRNDRKEKKRSNKNTRCNEIQFIMLTSLGLSTSNNWGWAEILENSFTLVELSTLHKNGLSSLSVTRVTTHSKIKDEWQHTQEMWLLQLKIVYNESRSRRIKLGEWKEARLRLNKDLIN
jgi:hypothetical protein